ncbi:hypothetical protein [Streptomyces sp. SP18BB07]|uniref:hypothetical protein n=1 Tax=Streptomyces sp. SP18BB07 TaxID=3002522 RepID=UPI002E7997D3|nr:hypothetical protein [Streptomyces sp. SP18BB07]MEE1761190.1 hypothetical protein [Streptomyces sp. SP18BB07]
MNTELMTAIVLGLVVNEFCDVCPWLARKVIRLAARLVPDPEVRERLAEEWAAGLHDRPGKILKLLSALTLLVSAATTLRSMYLPDRQRFRRLRRVASILFDREGRIVLTTTILSGLIQTYAPPLGETMWGWIATYGSLSLIINVADFWWSARKERRDPS